MKELKIEARCENVTEVLGFIGDILLAGGCGEKALKQVEIAAEEIFVNIASYAYEGGTGYAVVRAGVEGDPPEAVITFIDRGIPYDPLAKEDPDVTLPAEKRKIGGLGIFMARHLTDGMSYERAGDSNVLTIRKLI